MVCETSKSVQLIPGTSIERPRAWKTTVLSRKRIARKMVEKIRALAARTVDASNRTVYASRTAANVRNDGFKEGLARPRLERHRNAMGRLGHVLRIAHFIFDLLRSQKMEADACKNLLSWIYVWSFSGTRNRSISERSDIFLPLPPPRSRTTSHRSMDRYPILVSILRSIRSLRDIDPTRKRMGKDPSSCVRLKSSRKGWDERDAPSLGFSAVSSDGSPGKIARLRRRS